MNDGVAEAGVPVMVEVPVTVGTRGVSVMVGVVVVAGGGVTDGVDVTAVGVSVGGDGTGVEVSLAPGVKVIVTSFGVSVGHGVLLGMTVTTPVGHGGSVSVRATVGSAVTSVGTGVLLGVTPGCAETGCVAGGCPTSAPALIRQARAIIAIARLSWAIS